jgi:hypothetical protein
MSITVTWTMHYEPEDFEDDGDPFFAAADSALATMRDSLSTATIFRVTDEDTGESRVVDAEEHVILADWTVDP